VVCENHMTSLRKLHPGDGYSVVFFFIFKQPAPRNRFHIACAHDR